MIRVIVQKWQQIFELQEAILLKLIFYFESSITMVKLYVSFQKNKYNVVIHTNQVIRKQQYTNIIILK